MKHRDEIIKLSNEGKTRTEICQILGCSKSVVCYHLTDGQKQKTNKRTRKNRSNHPIKDKIYLFIRQVAKTSIRTVKTIQRAINGKIYRYLRERKNHIVSKVTLTYEDVMKKIGPNPTCYLTGESIELDKPSTYSLDHIIPISRGGDNSLENMGLCTRAVNQAKSDLLPDEFRTLCLKVIKFHNSSQI